MAIRIVRLGTKRLKREGTRIGTVRLTLRGVAERVCVAELDFDKTTMRKKNVYR